MRQRILRCAPYVRFALLGVVVITTILVHCQKFPFGTQVIGQDDLDRLCHSVTGCKSIRAYTSRGIDNADARISYVAIQDKKAKARDLRGRLAPELERLWKENSGVLSPRREDTILEVRGE